MSQREKQIICGKEYKEVDIVPSFEVRRSSGKGLWKKVSSPKQQNLNDKNARRYLLQLINSNFKDYRDTYASFSYSDEMLPETVEEAEKLFKNFIRRINYRLKKRGLPCCRYIAITSDTSTKDGRVTRIHHHLILNCDIPRTEIFEMWQFGRRHVDPLQGKEKNYADVVEYLRKNTVKKNSQGKKRWISSHGLKKPMMPPPNDYEYTQRQITKLAKEPCNIDFWEKKYPGWELIHTDDAYEATYNELTGWSIYLKLRRKQI